MYGSQWSDLEKIKKIFDEIFSKLRIPEIDERNSILDIKNKSDRKFLKLYKHGCISDYYSRTMIHLKKQKFLNEYGIDLDVLNSDKRLLK